jgi:hypothetical protein
VAASRGQRATSRLSLHPDVLATQNGESHWLRTGNSNLSLTTRATLDTALAQVDSWHAPRYGTCGTASALEWNLAVAPEVNVLEMTFRVE